MGACCQGLLLLWLVADCVGRNTEVIRRGQGYVCQTIAMLVVEHVKPGEADFGVYLEGLCWAGPVTKLGHFSGAIRAGKRSMWFIKPGVSLTQLAGVRHSPSIFFMTGRVENSGLVLQFVE